VDARSGVASGNPRVADAPAPAIAPAAPASRPAEVSPVVRDREAVGAVLDRYRRALSDLDPATAQAVWPSVNVKALERAFSQLESQRLEFSQCALSLSTASATASCSGTAEYVPKVGSKTPRVESRTWSFSLQQLGDRWVIQRVDTR